MFTLHATLSGLGLLRLEAVVQHLHSNVDVVGLTSDGDQALVRVGDLPRTRSSTGLGDADLALRLGADLVDLDTGLTNNCEVLAQLRCQFDEGLTGSDERVGDEDLLSLRAWATAEVGAWPGGTAGDRGRRLVGCLLVSTRLLAVRSGRGARVALLVLEKDGADVVDGDVDSVRDARHRQDALSRPWEHNLGSVETGARRILDFLDLGAATTNTAS